MTEAYRACPHHEALKGHIEQNAKDIEHLELCLTEVKKELHGINTNQAVMAQKFDNVRLPIWIIFAAVLGQVAQWLTTFAPVFKGQ